MAAARAVAVRPVAVRPVAVMEVAVRAVVVMGASERLPTPHSERHRPPGGVPPLSPPLSTNFRCCTGWPDGGVGPARKAPSNSGRPGVEGPVRIPSSGEGCGKDEANGVAEVGESGVQGERGQCRRLASVWQGVLLACEADACLPGYTD